MRPNHRWLRLFAFVVLLSVWAPLAHGQESEPAWKAIDEQWYTVEFGGGRAGWMSQIVQQRGEQLRTLTETQMKINRGPVPIEINVKTSFTETAGGKPLAVETTSKTSLQPMESKWDFTDEGIVETTIVGGRAKTTKRPAPAGPWLTPQAAKRYAQQQRKSGAAEFSYQTLQPDSSPDPVNIKTARTGDETIELAGRQLQVSVWKVTTELKTPMGVMALQGMEKVTAEGVAVHSQVSLMGMGDMIMRLSSKEQAQGVADGPLPELMFQTFITPDKPIENSMKAKRAKLRLTMKEGKMPALPSAGAQRVEMMEDGTSAILTIDINDNLPASAADAENKEYLAASAMIDSNDELIQKLATRAAARSEDENDATSDDPLRRAEALRRFANKHITKKGMATAFASASETAKMRTGDCSEHGVLLAALLRAEGIPARVATGLVYADVFAGQEGIFGWHMWTQALIDGKWVDFDATLPKRYNAAHVLASTSSLNDGAMSSDMASIIQLIGNLNIEVLEVEYD